jgi:hypothetical protein
MAAPLDGYWLQVSAPEHPLMGLEALEISGATVTSSLHAVMPMDCLDQIKLAWVDNLDTLNCKRLLPAYRATLTPTAGSNADWSVAEPKDLGSKLYDSPAFELNMRSNIVTAKDAAAKLAGADLLELKSLALTKTFRRVAKDDVALLLMLTGPFGDKDADTWDCRVATWLRSPADRARLQRISATRQRLAVIGNQRNLDGKAGDEFYAMSERLLTFSGSLETYMENPAQGRVRLAPFATPEVSLDHIAEVLDLVKLATTAKSPQATLCGN